MIAGEAILITHLGHPTKTFKAPLRAKATARPANVEAFPERARSYGVRGLKKFVLDLARDWRDGASHVEGLVDAEGDAIEIITIHSAKGLEWPVDSDQHRHLAALARGQAKIFRNSAYGSMTRNNPDSTQCSASPARCGEISTPSQTR
jgi:hypothetical protein